ncbi:MAG: hypothetical protein ACYCT6_09465 [bacterium]
MTCSNKLIEIYDLNILPVFNPFADESNNDSGGIGPGTATNRTIWDPLNKELYKAINILILAWDIKNIEKYKTITRILSFLTKNPDKKTQDWTIEKINEMIGKDKKGRTIKQMIKSLGANNIKDIEFTEINKKINEIMQTKKYLKNNFI